MHECLHSKLSENMKKKIYVVRKKKTNRRYLCKICRSEDNLSLCTTCMYIYCFDHVPSHRSKNKHILYYNFQQSKLNCEECGIAIFCNRKKSSFNGGKMLDYSYLNLEKDKYTLLKNNALKGIVNLGNTCYINSLLQLLMNIQEFRYLILANLHSCKDKHCMVCGFKKLYKMYYNSETKININEFILALKHNNKEYCNNEQHDVHLLYLSVIDNLKEIINNKIFFLKYKSYLKCMSRGNCNTNKEINLSLSLEYSNSLEDSINDYFKQEILKKIVFCHSCNRKTDFKKFIKISKYPRILVLHIKRFEYSGAYNESKDLKKIEGKIEVKKMIKIKKYSYQLYGIIIHIGRIDYGHYLSYNNVENDWYCCNDTNVYKVSENDIPFQNAYLLLYRRM